jgi:hypothetical protein
VVNDGDFQRADGWQSRSPPGWHQPRDPSRDRRDQCRALGLLDSSKPCRPPHSGPYDQEEMERHASWWTDVPTSRVPKCLARYQ